MKNIYLSFCFILFFNRICNCQTITFNKTYNSGVDVITTVLEVNDGYMAIMLPSYPQFPQYLDILKTDFYGNVIWQKLYGDSSNSYSNYGLIKTYDGNFVTGAFLYKPNLNTVVIQLMKLDSLGDSLWTKNTFAPIGFVYNSSYIIETSDKGFLVTGQIEDTLGNDGNAFILKTDSLGNEQWHKIYGGIRFDAFQSSVQLSDNSYLSFGWTRSFGFGNNTNRDAYLVKTDSAGNFVWQKTFGTTDYETGFGITTTIDSNYLLSWTQYYFNNNTITSFITKIDTGGNVIWQHGINSPVSNELWWAREKNDKTIIAVGDKNNPVIQKDEGWIVKYDSVGNWIWQRTFLVNNDYSYLRDIQPTTDDGYIAAGFVFTGASGNEDGWLVKLDSMGCDSAGCPTMTSVNSPPSLSEDSRLQLYPNPAKEKIVIAFPHSLFSAARITIYDVMGKQVFQMPAFIQKQISVPVYQLSSGIYFVEINYEGKKERVKFVKE
jgi:hypothetical protein